jgi:pilus assembly protein Flp/PilA
MLSNLRNLCTGAVCRIHGVLDPDEGQGMIEYGLLVALISIAVIAVLALVGGGLTHNFQTVVNAL